MASSGKKGKKAKGKTFALTDFLADGSTGTPQPVIRSKAWADEVENDDDTYDMGGRNKQPVVLPTAPRATRSPNVDDENIPRNPPFNAYISNLQYDVDEEEISDFFKDMKIVNVRLPRDDRGGGRLRGFGYVEFESRDSLIAALNITDTTVKGRRMRIEVASSSDNERRRGGTRDMGYDMSRERGDGPDRTLGDWRSGPRDEAADGRQGPGDKGGNRDNVERGSFTRDNMDGPPPRDRGSFTRDNMDGPPRGSFTRDNMDGPAPRDRGSFTRDNMDGQPPRDRGSFTRDNMDGPPRGSFTRDNMSGPLTRGGGPDRDRGYFNRDSMDGPQSRDRGSFTRDNMDSSFSRRDGPGSRGRERGTGFRGGYGDRGSGEAERERFSDRGSFTRRDVKEEHGDGPSPQAPPTHERPKLNLSQRTVPDNVEEPVVAQAAIFGGAKPVDTAAREREIEERLAKQRSDPPVASKPVTAVESGEEESGVVQTVATPVGDSARQRRAPHSQDMSSVGPAHPRKHYSERDEAGRGRGSSRGAPPVKAGGAERPRVVKPEQQKSERDEPHRMPKLREQAAPNFIASNKYGVLPSEEDTANVSD